MRILFLIGVLFFSSNGKSQNLNGKKFYAQIKHSCIATTNGAFDRYTFLVMEFRNNKLYPSYLEIPSNQQTVEDPLPYKFENKILYLTKPLDGKEDMGLIFRYVNENFIPEKKRGSLDVVFRPSLNYYFKKNK